MIKAIVFDLDHTLFDRYATTAAIMPAFMEHFDVAFPIDKATELMITADKNFNHIGWELIYDFLIKSGMFATAPTYEEYCEFVLSMFRKIAVEFPFTKPMLTKLKEMGYAVGLITNGKSETQRSKLALLGLEPYFDEILISGEFGKSKPDTAPFMEMAKRFGIETSEMMYVGDNPKNDIEASRRAGCLPVWIMTTGTWLYPDIEKPEIQLETVEALPDILSSKMKGNAD